LEYNELLQGEQKTHTYLALVREAKLRGGCLLLGRIHIAQFAPKTMPIGRNFGQLSVIEHHISDSSSIASFTTHYYLYLIQHSHGAFCALASWSLTSWAGYITISRSWVSVVSSARSCRLIHFVIEPWEKTCTIGLVEVALGEGMLLDLVNVTHTLVATLQAVVFIGASKC
jgi:hypothetical protein